MMNLNGFLLFCCHFHRNAKIGGGLSHNPRLAFWVASCTRGGGGLGVNGRPCGLFFLQTFGSLQLPWVIFALGQSSLLQKYTQDHPHPPFTHICQIPGLPHRRPVGCAACSLLFVFVAWLFRFMLLQRTQAALPLADREPCLKTLSSQFSQESDIFLLLPHSFFFF
ncbi:UNVERIFIED_CONTAM: hypothetical protein K2H54_016151 [Gekko kuhli]